MAVDVLHLIKESDGERDAILYNIVITSLLTNGQMVEACSVLQMLYNEKNIGLTFRTLNAWLIEFGKQKRPDLALRFFEDSVDRFSVPYDISNVNAVITAFVATEKSSEAFNILQSCSQKYNLEPNEVSYATVMKGFIHEGQPQRAKDLFQEMISKKIVTGYSTFATLIISFISCNCIEHIIEFWPIMIARSFQPDKRLFFSTLKCLTEHPSGKQFALQIVREYKTGGYSLDLVYKERRILKDIEHSLLK